MFKFLDSFHFSINACLYYVIFRKPCSGYKLKEMNGSNIFSADSENGASESGTNGNLSNRTSVRIVQVLLPLYL